jgi:selenide,water dikinase
MKLLNKSGAEVMKRFSIRGATDITGYGLAGHALKMARASEVTISLNMSRVPLIGNSYDLADQGCIPGASFRNLEFVENETRFGDNLDYNLRMIAMDAQTSGGLLMSVPENIVKEVLNDLHRTGLTESAIIGSVSEKTDKLIYLDN